jgi:hypothetical protein
MVPVLLCLGLEAISEFTDIMEGEQEKQPTADRLFR